MPGDKPVADFAADPAEPELPGLTGLGEMVDVHVEVPVEEEGF